MTDLVPYTPHGAPARIDRGLEAAGVRIVETDNGTRLVEFPPELAERANVLLPVSEVAQAVDLFRPSIRALQLDPRPDGPHFYPQSGKLAPRKQALEALAQAAGLTIGRVRPLTRDELSAYPDGSIGFEATVSVRKGDGTPMVVSRTRVWNPEVEKDKVRAAVVSRDRPEGSPAFELECRKRWAVEREHAPGKCESKAINRAIRAALQIPHTFTAAEAARPFVVVGYDLAPDTNDPEVRRLVLEAAYGGASAAYGPAAAAALEPAAPAEPAPVPIATPQHEPADDDEPGEDGAPVVVDGGDFDGDEPGAAPAPGALEQAVQLDVALGLELPFGKHKGKTIATVLGEDASYVEWLASDAVKVAEVRAAAQVVLDDLRGADA